MIGKMRIISLNLIVIAAMCLVGCEGGRQPQQGYVDARFAYISDNFSGILDKIAVQRGALVKAGDLLFVLDQQPESYQLNQAQARVNQAQQQVTQNQAALNYATATFQRQAQLLKTGSTSKDAFDNAKSTFDQSTATLAASQANLIDAQASLEQARWTQGQKTVRATQDSLVFDTYYLPGELVPANQPVLSLLTADQIKVVFFVAEPLLGTIKLGQTVTVNCDGCQQPVTANISFISPQSEYTPPVIYSDETRAKLVYRIEAKPIATDATKLHPGQPVVVDLK